MNNLKNVAYCRARRIRERSDYRDIVQRLEHHAKTINQLFRKVRNVLNEAAQQ